MAAKRHLELHEWQTLPARYVNHVSTGLAIFVWEDFDTGEFHAAVLDTLADPESIEREAAAAGKSVHDYKNHVAELAIDQVQFELERTSKRPPRG